MSWERGQCSVWVLDFTQERFQNMSLGDFESKFVKAGQCNNRRD